MPTVVMSAADIAAQSVRGSNGLVNSAIASANEMEETVQSLNIANRIYNCDELSVMGYSNMPSGQIQLSIANGTLTFKELFFGTPMGVSSEAPSIPLWANIAQANRWDNDLANMTDNQGVGLPFYQELMKRILRKSLLVSFIDVICTDTAQRQLAPSIVQVPWNSPTDSKMNVMPYNAIYTEVNVTALLPKGSVIGEFFGLKYRVLPGQTVNFNIGVCGYDLPNFAMCKTIK